jgi:hypothetical protein
MGKPVSLKRVAVEALQANLPDEQNMGGEEKLARFQIAKKVAAGGEQDLTPEEVSKIKLLVGRCYGPVVVGRAYEILNG